MTLPKSVLWQIFTHSRDQPGLGLKGVGTETEDATDLPGAHSLSSTTIPCAPWTERVCGGNLFCRARGFKGSARGTWGCEGGG